KARHRLGQVSGKKRTAKKPLLKCRNLLDDVKTAALSLLRDKAPTNLPVSLLLGQQKQCRSQTGSMAIRRGTLTDPFGHVWLLATRKENISLEEMRQRFETMMKQGESH
ncbi:MAG TPA: hypothetical protein VFF50_02055, partial [Candidatus Deferrimicrobiaceae bacterium]|nr:hypothetical protein [Candidatus Deferrimicrobiaceae bacterium]